LKQHYFNANINFDAKRSDLKNEEGVEQMNNERPECKHNALQENKNQIECTVCGFVVQDQLFGTNWEINQRDSAHNYRRSTTGNDLGGAPIDRRAPEVRNRPEMQRLQRTDRRARRTRPNFLSKMLESVDAMDISSELKSRLKELLKSIDNLAGGLGRRRPMLRGAAKMEKAAAQEYLMRLYICFALDMLAEVAVTCEAGRLREEWNLNDSDVSKIQGRTGKFGRIALRIAPSSGKDSQTIALEARRYHLNTALEFVREHLATIIDLYESYQVLNSAKNYLALKGEPIHSINEVFDGEFMNQPHKIAAIKAFVNVLEAGDFEPGISRRLKDSVKTRHVQTWMQKNTRPRAAVAEEEE
jgi:hypothetical protein